MLDLKIAADISLAETLPAEFYRSKEIFDLSKEKIFARTWQFIGDTEIIKIPGQCYPVNLLEEYLNEPILLTRDYDDKLHCISNVCTHRGNLLIESPSNLKALKCRYHGRRFDLDGKFRFMPEFEECKNFPSEKDNLSKIPFDIWQNFIFVSLNPSAPMKSFVGDMQKRISWFDFERLIFEPSRSKDYIVRANWALYVENYLEGFHIPFVHSSLNDVLNYGEYYSELYPLSNLQLGIGKASGENFVLPDSSEDKDKNVSAYYFWLFPNMMFNFYPWGLSINIIKPLAADLTKVSFLTYVSDPSKLDKGAGSGLDRVEREDESIVEAVQKGMNSNFYSRGRYSPKREQGVHHFHRLLCDFINRRD